MNEEELTKTAVVLANAIKAFRAELAGCCSTGIDDEITRNFAAELIKVNSVRLIL